MAVGQNMSRLIFHWRPGGSGEIRGRQMAEYLGARQNCDGEGVHIWVKMQPPANFPARSYLDVVDAQERVSWLLAHPECGVIASSVTGWEYLRQKLNRNDIRLIPQHHCNYERGRREGREILVAGVAGGRSAILCDVNELVATLAGLGLGFRWRLRFSNRHEVAEFYRGLDVQIIWRKLDKQRPLKNPLKIVNAMSFGIPTVAYPELAYQEVERHYWSVTTFEELAQAIGDLRQGFDAGRLIDRAEAYHIDHIAQRYEELLA